MSITIWTGSDGWCGDRSVTDLSLVPRGDTRALLASVRGDIAGRDMHSDESLGSHIAVAILERAANRYRTLQDLLDALS